MGGELIFDTSFLIDFQRERRRGAAEGRAHAFLRQRPNTELLLPATAFGEFAEGFERPDDPVLEATARGFRLLPVDLETARAYAGLTRTLRKQGALIGTNDLWIAACALRHERPLVTRNTVEFSRIPHLEILAY